MPQKQGWIYPRIVAHRGGGTLAPENTLAALRCGLQHGFQAVEFDVMLAADGVPVLMHDEQLGRTVQGQGAVNSFTAGALQNMDAGSWKGTQFAAEPVPLFSQVIEFCHANAIWMNVEIKPARGAEVATGQAAATTLQAYLSSIVGDSETSCQAPLFSSFSFAALEAAKLSAPEIARGFLLDRVPPDWQDQLNALEAVALHTNHQHLTPHLATQIKAAGFGLFCYTVNDPARAREILAWGVDGFCTDRIDLIGPDFS